ncbi:MAG: ABC transporter [Nocardioides sp.]|nr:ABC transporter [Nocardioides sp.]
MTDTSTRVSPPPGPLDSGAPAGSAGRGDAFLDDPARRVDWRRWSGAASAFALALSVLAAVGEAVGTVVAGRVAAGPTGTLVLLLAVTFVGSALLNTVGRVVWAGVSDRAEGRLRADLLSAALHQPLGVLGEQAVGEVLDRVDDDTHEVGTLVRRQLWDALYTVFSLVPMWIVAGLTWTPAWVLFPAVAFVTVWVVRPLLGEIARRKVLEEMAWTDHAAALEEGVAARDDLRTGLGQAYVVRRLAELSAEIHRRFDSVVSVEARMARRAGLLLHGLLAGTALAGVALVVDGDLSIAQLVTLFLVTTTFVGQIDQVARHMPDLQAGLGAVLRLRQMLSSPPEPVGGSPLPDGPLDLVLDDLHFAYDEGTFALRGVDLRVPAGQTCALVGRTGSGKSTLASLVSRAVEPSPGSVRLGGTDVLEIDLQHLRAAVGVVTQRTEVLVGTLAENVALFGDVPRERIEAAVRELGLETWVAGLPDGLDTRLGPGGTSLSAGEEQLVAFARLLVRDVSVVVLDEATARMDPLTEARVVGAAERLLVGRTGLLVAHRLSTVARADLVAVLDAGTVVQHGRREDVAVEPGPFRRLLEASAEEEPDEVDPGAESDPARAPGGELAGARRQGVVPTPAAVPDPPSLARGTARSLSIHPEWGLVGAVLFLVAAITGAFGALTGFLWGRVVETLGEGRTPSLLAVGVACSILLAPLLLAEAFKRYPQWWIAAMLRVRMSVLVGQPRQHRLARTPAGEVVARTMDADRWARYADRWVDFVNGMVIVVVTSVAGGSLLAGGVLLAVMVSSALASAVGRPAAGRSAAEASRTRAGFGRSLVSALESVRTVKLAAATPDVHAHLRRVDGGRVDAAVREHRIQAVLDGVPVVLVQVGVVAAWGLYLLDAWGLATAILVAGAVNGFDWFGRVAGAVITEAPGTRAWQVATTRFAGGGDLMTLPDGVDLVRGSASLPPVAARVPLDRLTLTDVGARHDDGTVGCHGVDLELRRGELVLLLGQVGSGKSSLLGALAGLVEHDGSVRWNDIEVSDAQEFLRPGQVAHVAQVPRVLSGTFRGNVALDHDRPVDRSLDDARMRQDVDAAGGADALVGHRGVRLSGGQVQRLALARALAAETELLLADDVSSALDAATEIELWEALRARGTTVLGASNKRAALARADRVVVLVDGTIAETGPWSTLEPRWAHLAG